MDWLNIARGSLDRWRTMRDFRAREKKDAQTDYHEFMSLIMKSQDALERDQRIYSIEILRRAYTTFPRLAMTSQAMFDLLLKLELYDETEAVLARCEKRYQSQAYFLESMALLAFKRGSHEEAVRRCTLLRKKQPGSAKGYWIAAASLSKLDRMNEAEVVMTRGLRNAPADIELRIEYAKLSERRRDWAAALKRWTALAAIPDPNAHLIGVIGSAVALKELGRYGEAEQMFSNVMAMANFNLTFWIEMALLSEHKRDWEEAAYRWATLRKRFPLQAVGYVNGIRPLLELRQIGHAEDVLREGMDRIPDDPTPFIEYALVAHRSSAWDESASRWAVVRDRFPKRREGYEFGADALAALDRTLEALQLRSKLAAG